MIWGIRFLQIDFESAQTVDQLYKVKPILK